MPKIVIQNLFNREVIIHNEEKTILDTIHENDIDWMHACGKKGRCTTCKMIILQGEENLSPISAAEQKYFDMNKLESGERLSCQCKAWGDTLVKIPAESKFPHMKYSD